jgi:hypothetical protein
MALSDLDFSPGLRLVSKVQSLFRTSILPPPQSPSFILVASFGRSAIRLNDDSAALILQSCLGGQASQFRVSHLSGWCFQFEVCSKTVGLWLYDLKSFSCKAFEVHSSLWGNGGPNWFHQYNLWLDEQASEWTPVIHKKYYASVVKSNLAARTAVFKRLRFPADYHLNYMTD